MKILLVEDDSALAAIIKRNLSELHYVVDVVQDGATGWSYSSTFEYDLIILDVQLPHLDGLSLCQRLREEGDITPILLLTGQDSSAAKIQGLDAGADDYMVKPFDLEELIARIRALLRRGQGQATPLLSWGDLLLSPTTCEVTYGDRPLKLTAKEYKLLEILLRNGIHVVSSDEILDRLWSSEEFPAESTVRSHVRRLRSKLQAAGAPTDLISTLHGRGYYLKPSEPSQDKAEDPKTALEIPAAAHPTAQPAAPLSSEPAAKTAQYLQFLNDTWKSARPNCFEQLQALEQVLAHRQTLADPCLRAEDLEFFQALQTEGRALAHKLAGTLGVFGLTAAMAIARQIESLFQTTQICPTDHSVSPPLSTVNLSEIEQQQKWLQQLRHFLELTPTIEQVPQISNLPSPRLWFIGQDTPLRAELQAAAASQGLSCESLLTWEAVVSRLEDNTDLSDRPALLLAQLTSLSLPTGRSDLLQRLQQHLGNIPPKLPLLLLGQRDTLGDRLSALRIGGHFLLESSRSPEQIIRYGLSRIQPRLTEVKVMVVDDDPHWLTVLLRQLQPLGFKVTTLADPSHFWSVLQSVQPDALVLDIRIPEINGLELCQLVRDEPQWKKLPIFFLSILNDLETQNKAFSAGADDYLAKPILGPELAHRILARLQRLESIANLQEA